MTLFRAKETSQALTVHGGVFPENHKGVLKVCAFGVDHRALEPALLQPPWVLQLSLSCWMEADCPMPDRKLMPHACPMPFWERRQREEAKAKARKGKCPNSKALSPQPYVRLTPLELEGSSAHWEQPRHVA